MSDKEASTPQAQEASTLFLVQYRLSGMMLVSATNGHEASQMAVISLQALLGKTEANETPSVPVSQIRLGELAVEVEAAEALEFDLAEESLPPSEDAPLSPPPEGDLDPTLPPNP
jgi:hypothetical protein